MRAADSSTFHNRKSPNTCPHFGNVLDADVIRDEKNLSVHVRSMRNRPNSPNPRRENAGLQVRRNRKRISVSIPLMPEVLEDRVALYADFRL